MSADQLQRLEAGIKAAHAAGNAEHVKVLGAEYKRLKAGTSGPNPETDGAYEGFGAALQSGLDAPLEALGTTAEALGAEKLGGWLKGATDAPENYKSAMEGLINKDGSFYDLNYLPKAIVEQTGQFAGSVATRAGGAAAGGLVGGPVGATAGALAGPAAFEFAQQLGPVALERAKNNGRSEPNWEDWAAATATAAASGAMNAIAPNSAGMGKRILAEGLTEGAQSVVEQTGQSLGTDAGFDVDLRQAGAEALAGAGSAGAVDSVTHSASAVLDTAQNLRTDSREFSDTERLAAARILKAADGEMDTLANVTDTGEGTAKGAANAALREARAELETVAARVRKLVTHKKNDDAQIALKTLTKQAGHQGTPSPESHIERLRLALPNEADVERLTSLVHEINHIQEFTKGGTNDIGGLAQYTRNFDLTDKRSSMKLGMYAAIAGGASLGGVVGAAGTVISGFTANKIAAGIDKVTNRRSRVKRFVESAKKSGTVPNEIQGSTATESLDRLKKMAAVAKANQQMKLDVMKAQGQGIKTPKLPAGQTTPKAQATLDQSKATKVEQQAQANAERFSLNSISTETIFAEDRVPEGQPHYEPYLKWQEATGLGPDTTLQVLEALAQEGKVQKDIPQRFREDIRSFSTKKDEVYALQNIVRERANPDYKPKFSKADKNADAVLKKFKATDTKAPASRGKLKSLEGGRRALNLVAEIEDAESTLNSDQYQMMMDLKESIDSPAMTRAERFKLVNEMLPMIFPDHPPLVEMWKKKFTPLASIGNDYAIHRKETETDPVQQEKETSFDKKKEAAVKRKKEKSKKSADDKPELNQPEKESSQPKTKADRALDKLTKPKSKEVIPNLEPETASVVVENAVEPQVPTKEKSKKLRLKDRVTDRIAQINYAVALAEGEAENLDQHISELPKNTRGRVEGMFYEFASDRLTVNQLADSYAEKYGIPPVESARIVNEELGRMEAEGLISRFSPRGSNQLKYDGKFIKGEDGKNLQVVQVEFKDQGIIERVEVAKAIKMRNKIVPQDGPSIQYGPNQTQDGSFSAFKDIDKSRADETFTPMFNFLQAMRNAKLSMSNIMLNQLENALGGTNDKNLGTIGEVLLPKEKGSRRRDESPLRTLAQVLFQVGTNDERSDSRFRQEWMAGANLRVYSKNGLAHTQAGDMMKGMIRAPERSKLGGEGGFKYLLHGFGNLLGHDKKSPKERRDAIFQGNTIDNLVKFAEDPFGRLTMKDRNGNATEVSQMVKDGEGFFQVLNVANEVKSVLDWSKERHPDKAGLPSAELLSHPDVQADLSANYETDFIVQLDASNNAYQIAGMLMGYEKALKSTGMLPPDGVEGTDPDQRQGADIYLEPAKAISALIPEIDNLGLPDSKLRKIFKGPIGTYLYAAEFSSRQESFQDTLEEIADGADVFGIDGEGLIPIPQSAIDGMKSDKGHFQTTTRYDVEGNVKLNETVRKRVKPKGDGFVIETGKGINGKFTAGKLKFKTEEEAIKYSYGMDMYGRMNRELVRDMNVRFPEMKSFLDFAKVVSSVVQEGKGSETINVPTKDGMMLQYSFKQTPAFAEAPITLADGNVVKIGVRTSDYKLAGRGLAAFMAHQTDAYALRETHKRLADLKVFNPIHDSYGFHPSDATRGQQTWVEVMQELGSGDYNIFLQILEANKISLPEYQAAGGDVGFILNRRGVDPVPASQLPTALS